MELLRNYLRVMRVLGTDRGLAWLLTGANLVIAGLLFLDPLLFGRVIERISGPAPGGLTMLLGLWGVVGAASIGANILVALHADRLAHRNRLKAMGRFYAHVLSLPPSFHGEAQSGRLMKVMNSGAGAMFNAWLTFFREAQTTLATLLVMLPLTVLLNWRLSIGLIALVVVFCVLIFLVIGRTEQGQSRAEDYQYRLIGVAQDALSNVVVVQSFARLRQELQLFEDTTRQVIRHQFPVLNWWALAAVMTRGASTIAVIGIVALGTWLHARGLAGIGEIISFVGLATMLIGRLDGTMGFVSRLFFEAPNVRAFFAVMDTATTVPERAGAIALPRGPGEVRFDDVRFGYPQAPVVLGGIDFVARPGSTVALVGQTGAGKSTAMALLQRLWDPNAGVISIDGHDIRDITIDSLRQAIGVVFQDSMLLNRTIRENLQVGRPEATQAELERACRLAEAHDFILRQQNGYDTMVGERGVTLSGGQRQRLAIARALLKDPPILILDEATSALDAATEARVSRALAALMAGRTTFIIAHRLSTVRDADEILVFDQGRIAERGNFAALMAQNGIFATLVATQLEQGRG